MGSEETGRSQQAGDEMRGRVSRRSFVKTAVAGAGALAVSGGATRAQSNNVIKIGFVSPRTGALAAFGEPDPFVFELARKALADGISAGGKTYKVEILDRDTQSDPSRAGQLAKSLINSDAVDFMLTTSTPETVNPVADACEAAGVPCLSTGMPWEPWYFGRGAKPGEPSPFHWTYHFGFGVANFSKAYISQWNGSVKTNNRVAFLMPNDADGNALRTIFKPILEKAGFTVIDPGGYEDGTTDYAAQIAKFKAENCQIFTTGPIPPDFAVFWRQAAQQGYTRMVKIAQIAKTGLFPSQVEVAGFAGTEARHGGFLASNLPVQVVVDRSHLPAARRQVREGHRQAVESMLGDNMALIDAGIAALKSSDNPKNRKLVREGVEHTESHDAGWAARLDQGSFPERLPDGLCRDPVGDSQAGQQVQARYGGHR